MTTTTEVEDVLTDVTDDEEEVQPIDARALRIVTGRAALYTPEFRGEARGFSEPFRRCVREQDPESRVAGQFEMREVPNGSGGTSLLFSGYAAVVERSYEMEDMFGPYTETVGRQAFKRTLSENPDVNFLCNHSGVTMARTKPGTLKLSADSTGLYSEARLNTSRSDVQIIRAAVEDGDLDEMSFAFRCTDQEWDESYENRLIREVSLHQGDVSIVNYGANPHTAGLVGLRSRNAEVRDALRSLGLAPAVIELIELVGAIPLDQRAGKTLSAGTMTALSSVLDLVSSADDAVDQAQITLSNLMGVPNPDDDTKFDQGAGADDAPAAGNDDGGARSRPSSYNIDRARLALARLKGDR